MTIQPTCLLILDGWGLAPADAPGNAIAQANTPHFDRLWKDYPHTSLLAHGPAVGMPEGVVGNSEVGHRTLGTGRATPHARVQLDEWMAQGQLETHPVWQDTLRHLNQTRGTLHLISLFSTGGVHSHVSHLAEFLGMAKDAGVQQLRVHGITDGRDMPPYTAMALVEDIEGALYDLNRWDRTEQAFQAIVHGQGRRQFMATQAVKFVYTEDRTEEFIQPSICDLDYQGMERGDAVLFLNFRPDRMRQFVQALAEPDFDSFARQAVPSNLHVSSLVEACLLPAVQVYCPTLPEDNTLAKALVKAGQTQFHIAETEKYAHVTYFFNGGHEPSELGEDRVLIPSRRDVDTYDQAPAMKAYDIAQALIQAMRENPYSFYVANLANIDMVAHTGNEDATIKAVEHVDEALGLIAEAACVLGMHLIVTSDHGNGECMRTLDGGPNTAHTTNPVPFIWCPPADDAPQKVSATLPRRAELEHQITQLKTLAEVRGFVEAVMGLRSLSASI
jgi:2,3-bisphosphoglycerate-independent phosphoglycerate mutase